MTTPKPEATMPAIAEVARAIRDDILTIRFDNALRLDDHLDMHWIEVLCERAALAALRADPTAGDRGTGAALTGTGCTAEPEPSGLGPSGEHPSREGFDLYADPNPPAWPNNGIPFNRWYGDLTIFLNRLRSFKWYKGPTRFKYVQICIDTRNGHFTLRDRDGNPASPDDIFPGGPASATEAEGRNTEGGSVHEGAAGNAGTPDPSPLHPHAEGNGHG